MFPSIYGQEYAWVKRIIIYTFVATNKSQKQSMYGMINTQEKHTDRYVLGPTFFLSLFACPLAGWISRWPWRVILVLALKWSNLFPIKITIQFHQIPLSMLNFWQISLVSSFPSCSLFCLVSFHRKDYS